MRTIQIAGIVVVTAFAGGLLLILGRVTMRAIAEGITGTAIGVSLFAVVMLLLCTTIIGWMVRWMRLALILEPDAVIVRGVFRTVRTPWTDVARIESASGTYWRHATRVVSHHGSTVTAIGTSYQYVFFRGERFDEQSRDPDGPLRPTRMAMAAHQRWLRANSIPRS